MGRVTLFLQIYQVISLFFLCDNLQKLTHMSTYWLANFMNWQSRDLRFLKMKASSIPLTWLRTRKDNLLKYLQGRLANVEKVCYSKWLNLNTLAIHGYEILRVWIMRQSAHWIEKTSYNMSSLSVLCNSQRKTTFSTSEKQNPNKNENNQLISFKFLEREDQR